MLGSGETVVADVPEPSLKPGHLLVRSRVSLISPGTERMLVEFGKANLLDKARQQPEKVRMVIDKARADGFFPTLDAVRNKLDKPLPLGYCNVGTVQAIDTNIDGLRVGDRIASNGNHAGVVRVPINLCARIPDSVSDETAAFTVLTAIGLHGIRLAKISLGESVVVTGLGLIGLLTVQVLRAHGCRVLALDFDSTRLRLAEQFGAEIVDLAKGECPLEAADRFSRARGVDAVLITATSKSSEPVRQAARMCRKRGRIVMIGVTGMELSRSDFFEKELSFQVSCSYGPGRYDPNYEEKGQDYPIGYVRWTEQRNFEAVLDLMASGAIDVDPLISHRFSIDSAESAYKVLGSNEPALGILINYPQQASNTDLNASIVDILSAVREAAKGFNVGVIGAGNYAGRILIPAFAKADACFQTLVGSGGVQAVHNGKKYGFLRAATDPEVVFSDTETTVVVIATQHDSHADLVVRALRAGKNVFVEKPLCLTLQELNDIKKALAANSSAVLMVGFNRRFAPLSKMVEALLESVNVPKSFVMTINAGALPGDHWTQDPDKGGGRIVGEGCHFIDLMRFFAKSPISDIVVSRMHDSSDPWPDKAVVCLEFEDGSHGVIQYLANGHAGFPKERLEVFCRGRVIQLDNFRRLKAWGWSRFRSKKMWRQDKGQEACVAAFAASVRGGLEPPIPHTEIFEVSEASIRAQEALF